MNNNNEFYMKPNYWKLDKRTFNAFNQIAEPVQFKMYGKEINLNRSSISYVSNSVKNYKYPGSKKSISIEWDGYPDNNKDFLDPWGNPDPFNDHLISHEEITMLMDLINEEFNENLNYALVNVYHNGDDYLGFHRDDKIKKGTSIYSLSFGATRKMVFKNNDEKHELILNSGTLLKFTYEQNQKYKHSIPKQTKIKDIRINITFRTLE